MAIMGSDDEVEWGIADPESEKASNYRIKRGLRFVIGGFVWLFAAYFIVKLPRLSFHTGNQIVTYNRADYPVSFNVASAVAALIAILLFASAARLMLRKPERPSARMSMWALMFFLMVSCLAAVASAVTAVLSFYWSSHNGTVVHSITYWHGYWRVLPLVYAAFFAAAFYGVYRRLPIAWKLGWLYIIVAAAHFIFFAWVGLIDQPKGAIGALAATFGAIIVAVYWGVQWYKRKSYFMPDEDHRT